MTKMSKHLTKMTKNGQNGQNNQKKGTYLTKNGQNGCDFYFLVLTYKTSVYTKKADFVYTK